MAIYENVKRIGKERRHSISSIERDLHFTKGSIYKWNKSAPGIQKVRAVANLLDCSIEDLVGDTEWEKNTQT